MKKLFMALGALVVFSVLSATIVHAVSIGPTDFRFTLNPGESGSAKVSIGNNEDIPKIASADVIDFIYNAEKKQTTYPEEGSPYGLTDWVTYDTDHLTVDPGENFQFEFKVTVPQGTDPGLYQAALIGRTENPEVFNNPESGPKVGMGAGAVAKIYVNVPGAIQQSINIKKFEIDKKALLQNNLMFVIEVKNTGTVFLAPRGEITLSDSDGNPVPKIFTIKQVFEEQEVVTDRKDAIPFNNYSKELLPGQLHTFTSISEDVKIEPGKYKAKLTMFFGQDDEKKIIETDFFNINQEEEIEYTPSNINLTIINGISFSGPIKFNLKVKPDEDLNNISSAEIEIKNMFGGTKATLNLNIQELKDDLYTEAEWSNPFGLGFYTAELKVMVGDELQKNTASFFYLSWWLALVLVLVLLVLIIGVPKYISNYNKLKEKVEKAEHKDEKEESEEE